MPWESLAYLLALLLAGLITPGPNNITCTVHAVVHGKKSNVSLIAGMALGFLSIHFICGLVVDYFDEDGNPNYLKMCLYMLITPKYLTNLSIILFILAYIINNKFLI